MVRFLAAVGYFCVKRKESTKRDELHLIVGCTFEFPAFPIRRKSKSIVTRRNQVVNKFMSLNGS